MKYYKNLLKRKKYIIVLMSVLFTLLGIGIILNSGSIIFNEIISKNQNNYNDNFNTIIFEELPKIIIGLFIVYFALIYYPVTLPYAQNDEEFEVKSVGDSIYVKFKDNEILLKKEHFFIELQKNSRDKNGKHIGVTRRAQIYRFLKNKYPDIRNKEINKEKICKNEDIITRFNSIRLIDNKEKEAFIKNKKLKKSGNKAYLAFSIFTGIIALVMFFEIPEIENIIGKIFFIVMGIIAASVTKVLYECAMKDKALVKKIRKNNMYMADCFSFDKKVVDPGPDCHWLNYYIRVTDNNENYIDEWFEISSTDYNSINDGGTLKAKLFVLQDKSEYKFFILTPSEEK